MSEEGRLREIARALRSPFVPGVFERLATCEGYLDACWPQIEPSVETAGFAGSALHLADMALEAVIEAYEPVLSRESLRKRGLGAADLEWIADVLDVMQWVQPQTLLICAALVEALDVPSVGGQGRAERRETTERERAHLATEVRLAPAERPPLPAIAAALQLREAPELYRTVGIWPAYVEAAWAELQHFPAYPALRRRARALYYYARSAARFLAFPLEASEGALQARGVDAVGARVALDEALPVLATMVVHCSAMRVGLGITAPEVMERR